jgi:hypothetical protein
MFWAFQNRRDMDLNIGTDTEDFGTRVVECFISRDTKFQFLLHLTELQYISLILMRLGVSHRNETSV